jgi:glycosyltransferase involved in cell wall biosynthesis
MNPRSVTFLFPHPTQGPTGGYKVVYEYANRLAADGWEVHIAYSGSIYFAKKSLFHKCTNVVRYFQTCLKGYSSRSWFPIDPRVKEHFTLSLNYRHVPHTACYVATSPYTAFYLNTFPTERKRMFYFIQGYENWGPGLRAILFDTYHYPMRKLVIAKWLQRMLKEEHGEDAELIPNGFDFEKFRLTVPIEEKNRYCVSMLYHTMELKEVPSGMEALRMVKREEPRLKVLLFGTPARPDDLPDWMEYHQRPDDATHSRINNEAAIYLGTSRIEGWGLTVGEAMQCGQAVCCTDIGGFREMATDGETALLSPVGDSASMARHILQLMRDDELRQRIARQGHAHIQSFTWDRSYQKFKSLLTNAIQ